MMSDSLDRDRHRLLDETIGLEFITVYQRPDE